MYRVLLTVIFVLCMAGALRADTLYLRNGSVLRGTFVGYENGQFIFEITSDESDRSGRGRTLRFPARDVLRLVIERDSGGGRDDSPRPFPGGEFESFPPLEVRLLDQWVRSEIEVGRGQRVRVEASGQIYLDGRTPSSPDGINRRDPDAPLPEAPDGALVAAIGSDPNSPAILIGRSREFTADRDGMLYFSVNHWDTTNARGFYTVRVSVERRGSGGAAGRRPREQTLTVSADRSWLDTGIEVEPGMQLEVSASGTIEIGNNRRAGPEGNRAAMMRTSTYPVPNAGVGALIAKIRYRRGGDSNLLVIGAGQTVIAEPGEYGRLWLGINDDYFADNRGSFTVRIRW
jgi:hypothetical protein